MTALQSAHGKSAPTDAGADGSADGIVVARLSDEQLIDPDFTAPRWNGSYETYGGARVFVRRLPSTSPDAQRAVFVHGLGGSATNWTDVGGLLSSRLDCAAVDLPGFGRSGPAPRGNYSIGALAEVIVAGLEADGRAPVHLFGNSMGGAVALRVAATRPDLVRTLTLISPALPDLRLRRPGTDTAMGLLLVPGISGLARRRMAAISPAGRVRGMIQVCFAQPQRVPQGRLDEAVEDMTRHQALPWSHEAFTRSLRGVALSYVSQGRRSPWQLLAQVQAPTLIVWGDQDRLVPAALAPRAARAVAQSRLLVLPGVGHCAQMEDPVATARAVLALLDDYALAAGPGQRSR